MVNEEVILHNEAVISPDWQYQCFKADDYKCSLCGIEMPPDFVEERQEHSDFHLAERLQEKESSINSRTSIERHRYLSVLCLFYVQYVWLLDYIAEGSPPLPLNTILTYGPGLIIRFELVICF